MLKPSRLIKEDVVFCSSTTGAGSGGRASLPRRCQSHDPLFTEVPLEADPLIVIEVALCHEWAREISPSGFGSPLVTLAFWSWHPS